MLGIKILCVLCIAGKAVCNIAVKIAILITFIIVTYMQLLVMNVEHEAEA